MHSSFSKTTKKEDDTDVIPPLPARLAARNPRAVVSLYFVVLCVALSWLWTSSSNHYNPNQHQHATSTTTKTESKRWEFFGMKNFFSHNEQHQDDNNNNNNNRNADSLSLKSSGNSRLALSHETSSTPTISPPAGPTTTEEVFAGIKITEEEKTLGEHLIMTVLLLMLSAMFAGLTLGIMGLDTLTLEVIAEAAPEPDRSYAREILPVRHLGHQCLCTLILGNMWANVMIANVSSDILPGEGGPSGGGLKAVMAFFLSTFLILIFAEILPMSVCTGPDALKIAATAVPVLKIFIFLLYPIAKPLGWVLDKLLHHDPGQIYDREELKKLFVMHAQKHQDVSGLKNSELDLLLGAFDFGDRVVQDVMTPFETVVVLRSDAVLDAKLLRLLWACGHSRFPIIDAAQLPSSSTATATPNSPLNGTQNNNNNFGGSLRSNNGNNNTNSSSSAKSSLKVPVDMLDKVQIIGLLYVKDLLLVMDQNLTVEEVLDMFPHGEVYSVWQGAKLRHLLTSFQQGVTHLVFVRSNPLEEDIEKSAATRQQQQQIQSSSSPREGDQNNTNNSSSNNNMIDEIAQRADTLSVLTPQDKIIGIVTLEALIETLIRAPIWDEHDDEEDQQQQQSPETQDTSHLGNAPNNNNNNQLANGQHNNSTDNAIISVISQSPVLGGSNPFNQQHQAMRLRRQMKSVHFFDFAVTREEASRIPEGSAVHAPALTTPQCLAIGRFLRQSVESFTPFVDDSLIARLVVGSEVLIMNPRKYSDIIIGGGGGSDAGGAGSHNNNNPSSPSVASNGSPIFASSAANNSSTVNQQTSFAAAARITSTELANEQPLTGVSPVAGHPALQGKFTNNNQSAAAATDGSNPGSASAVAAGTTTVVGTAALSMVQNAAAAAVLAPKLTKDIRSPATTLYSRGERSEYFTIILGGSVRIIAGREQFHHEIHTFRWLGEHALMSSDGGFIPSFDAFAVTPCRVLRIHTRAFNAVRSVASLNAMANSVAATARFSLPPSFVA